MNGIDLIITVACLIAALAIFTYASWADWDRRRRSERLSKRRVHRNLNRMMGR